METLLGYQAAEAVAMSSFRAADGPWKAPQKAEWVPSEGGPLMTASSSPDAMMDRAETLRFGVDGRLSKEKAADVAAVARERDLTTKLLDLLSSPFGEGVARIIEEMHRLLPSSGQTI
jgi:hypothetical protein